jgi:hypothetical protein
LPWNTLGGPLMAVSAVIILLFRRLGRTRMVMRRSCQTSALGSKY